jgi:hypothetical protein
MPHPHEVSIPRAGFILLAGRDGGVSIEQVDYRISGISKRWNTNIEDTQSARMNIALNLVIQFRRARSIRCEDDVEAAVAGDLSAVISVGEIV